MNKLALLVFVAACGGGGDDGDGNNPDANQPPRDAAVDARPVDAPPSAVTVMTVDCAGATIAQTVMTANFAFTPATVTINANDVVRFMPESVHNVVPATEPGLPTDPGLKSGAVGAVACLRFTVAGEFNYRCGPHASMKGKVTVQ